MQKKTIIAESKVHEDRRAKWERGAREHGVVMKLDPLTELYQEALDAINYTSALLAEDHAFSDLHLRMIEGLRKQFIAAAKVTLYLAAENPHRHYSPQEIPFR